MKIFIKFSLLLMALCLSVQANAQRKVSGKVLDGATKEALIGASVVVKGTTKGALTDVNGAYSVDVDKSTTTANATPRRRKPGSKPFAARLNTTGNT